MKNRIKLDESQLKKIVAESVKRMLKEEVGTEYSWNTVNYSNVSYAFDNLENCIKVLKQENKTPNGNPEIDTEERMIDDAIIACNELIESLNDMKRVKGYDS